MCASAARLPKPIRTHPKLEEGFEFRPPAAETGVYE